MSIRHHAALGIVLTLGIPVGLAAQSASAAKPKHETQAQLLKEAKVTLASASATALKEVPAATITEHELEREKGKLIWSFDMKIAGKSGTEEVNVDAMTGSLVDHTHESPADEAKEAAAATKP